MIFNEIKILSNAKVPYPVYLHYVITDIPINFPLTFWIKINDQVNMKVYKIGDSLGINCDKFTAQPKCLGLFLLQRVRSM